MQVTSTSSAIASWIDEVQQNVGRWAIPIDENDPHRIVDFWASLLRCEVIEPGAGSCCEFCVLAPPST
jgi:hypothetical protein